MRRRDGGSLVHSADPDSPPWQPLKPAEIRAAVLATAADPAPWHNAAPVCSATLVLAEASTAGWSARHHWLHHEAVRDAVRTVVLLAARLRARPGPLSLPDEMWRAVLRFVLRSHWRA